MQLSLKKLVSPSVPPAALMILICCPLWLFNSKEHRIFETAKLPVIEFVNAFTAGFPFYSKLINLVLVLLNGFLLMQLNNKYTLTRSKTFLLFIIFFFLVSSWFSAHYNIAGNISALMLVLSFHIMLGTYNNRYDTTEAAFICGMLVSAAGIFLIPEYLLFVVPLWLGMAVLKSLSLRTFLASITGIVVPLIAATVFVPECYSVLRIYFTCIFTDWMSVSIQLHKLQSLHIYYFAFLLIINGLYIIDIYTNLFKNVVRTRVNINFMILFFVFTVLISILCWRSFANIQPLAAVFSAVLISQSLSEKDSNFYIILFWIFVAISSVYAFNSLFA